MAREPYNMTQEQIDNIAQRLHSYEADDYTLKWGKQTSKYRNSMRKSVRNMLSALEQDGFKLAGRSPAPAAGIEDLLKKAVAAFNALSPEQQAEMLEDQRQSWVRGNIGLIRDERGMTSPVMPQPTTAMASELKPWRYEIKYGPDGEESYSWVYDDQGVMVAPMRTHKAKEVVDRMNTRPVPAATDTGLVTVGWLWEYAQYRTDERGYYGYETVITENNPTDHVSPAEKLRNIRELCTRSQAEELMAAKDANYAGLVQQTINQQVQINALEADNAALTAKLETANALVTCCCGNPVDSHGIGDGHSPVDQYHYAMMQLEEQNAEKDAEISAIAGHLDCEPDSDSILHTVREIEADKAIYKERAEALEAKLAAAEKALEKLLKCPAIADECHTDPEWGCEETAVAVQEARAVLGGKPS